MNVNSGGFSQTLYNIFLFIHPADFLFITSTQANKISPTSAPFTSRALTYNLQLIPILQNRLGSYVNVLITAFNLSFNKWFNRFASLQQKIKNFNPDLVVVAPNGIEGVVIYSLLKEAFNGKKAFPYFMDDWLFQLKENKTGKYIHALTKQLLQTNTSWMMISESLGKIFAERYAVLPDKLLVIHNPVNMRNVTYPEPVHKKEEYTIAYAGALWPMHFDALAVIANAIKVLQKQRKLKLVVYTGKSNWEWRKNALELLDVKYGGHIPYKLIHATLGKADCLLITSSFSHEWQTHSKGSVQTKITDYLKAGRLVISCGPVYAASSLILKQHKCGVCIETSNVQEAAKQLDDILNNIDANQRFVQNGYDILKSEFSFEVVHERLIKFLVA